MLSQKTHPVRDEEKRDYIFALDSALTSLSRFLSSHTDSVSRELKDFGDANKWDWTRIPEHQNTSSLLAELVDRVRSNYSWFGEKTNSANPTDNYKWFKEINVSAESGLPWLFDFVELHRLKNEGKNILARMDGYREQARKLGDVLLHDTTPIEEVRTNVSDLRSDSLASAALKRNFLEKLQVAELLEWKIGKASLAPRANLIILLGSESLWNISSINYNSVSGMFECLTFDAWQDDQDQQITPDEAGNIVISDRLKGALQFAEENKAWYIIQQIDANFTGLHPVNLTRGLIGPFENKYMTAPRRERQMLPSSAKILAKDPQAAFLRFKRQYSYAPNHREVGGRILQIIHQEDWCDEYIMTPAEYAKEVSQSVLGTNVKVITYGGKENGQ